MKRTRKVKRTRKPPVKQTKQVCDQAKSCWYKGSCAHREPHLPIPTCDQHFCSVISVGKCNCIEEK